MYEKSLIECCDKFPDANGSRSLIAVRRRCTFQWQICVLSVMIAFFLGIALGVFLPMIGDQSTIRLNYHNILNRSNEIGSMPSNDPKPLITPITVDNVKRSKKLYEVSFITTKSKQKDFQYKFREVYGKDTPSKKKYPKKLDQILWDNNEAHDKNPMVKKPLVSNLLHGIISDEIYWGKLIEDALPTGFHFRETSSWSKYVQTGIVTRLEIGCGRMQNRLVIFQDGQRACARYRQNTDQIQGELFSFYLGQLLNLSNIVPSAASLVDVNSKMWELATQDIINAQWKSNKPVILTKWLPDLESADIPKPFQSFERHLNKMDIINITENYQHPKEQQRDPIDEWNTTIIHRFTELAQWSDLIVFDYLIANLDRVVNNLYNYQWNSDMMAAPAHNLARLKNSHLLVFLDNESGLLHGYRLLKKYEAYHGLLLNNLCIFRWSTIDGLQHIREHGVGHLLQKLYELNNSESVRDVLPTLPEKSIKILNDRIDRVLTQVQKCKELFTS